MVPSPLPVVVTPDLAPHHNATTTELVITIPCSDPAVLGAPQPWLCWRELLGER